KAFDERRDYIVNALNEIPGVKCLNPQGAFYVFPNISAWGIPSMELATRLLEEVNIAVIPGVAFGADENIRISFAISLEDLKEAIARLKKWVAENID
ncbi:aminotransferase class I/II-fold pyridoxal phosphate-dependent enzyme, partial [bacterium]|nr:aminotransferase class I/II-fold pyridoxal phosphate-dependent enzyme [bacterium]